MELQSVFSRYCNNKYSKHRRPPSHMKNEHGKNMEKPTSRMNERYRIARRSTREIPFGRLTKKEKKKEKELYLRLLRIGRIKTPIYCDRCQKSVTVQHVLYECTNLWQRRFHLCPDFPKSSQENAPILDGHKFILQNINSVANDLDVDATLNPQRKNKNWCY